MQQFASQYQPMYSPVTVKPGQGGDLVTRMAFDNVGPANYTIKRDWRRVMDSEIRREGDVLFYPNTGIAIGTQPTPPTDGSPITLIHHARKPDGKTALIVGTQDQLFRFYSFEDGEVYAGDTGGSGVYATGVYEDISGSWISIWSSPNAAGHRWEAVEVSGKTVFNNGSDLPMLYDVSWDAVKPIYELREQGIARVGTIGEFNGALFCGDISEVIDTDLPAWMTGRSSADAVTITMSAGFITASGSFFKSTDVGQTIIFKNTGEYATITSFFSATHVQIDRSFSITVPTFVTVAGLYNYYPGTVNRVQYAILWSNFGNAADFASVITGNMTVGSFNAVLDFPAWSFQPGDEILVEGAGDAGSALDAIILSINYNHTVLTLDTAAITEADEQAVEKASALSSISGEEDLEDDGSAILRITQLQGRMVVLKDTGIFLGAATGDATNPFQFSIVYRGTKTIFWQWMMENINGTYLLFAGKNEFFTFDLSSLLPQVHPKMRLCSDIFYSNVTDETLNDQCFSAINEITAEVWFTFPNSTTDKAICYDYKYESVSTSAAAYTATGTIKKPVAGVSVGAEENWFIMAHANNILQYGLTDVTPGIWTRNTANYDSLLKSGYVDFGDGFNEKDLRAHVVYFGNVSPAPIELTMFGARNANEPPQTLFVRSIAAPTYKNLTSTYFKKIYFQDQLRVTGSAANCELTARTFQPAVIQSQSTTRHA